MKARSNNYKNWVYVLLCSITISACGGGGGGGGGDPELTRVPNSTVIGCFVEDYPDPATSPYVLPYQIGTSFLVNNGNCGISRTHQPNCSVVNSDGTVTNCGDARYSYDWAMPIGIVVTAARGGTVLLVEDSFSNATNGGDEVNFVTIEHDDGTVASYVHFSPNSILVSPGDIVSKGDALGMSGSSGFTDPPGTDGTRNPHLHLQVFDPPFVNCSPDTLVGCITAPLTFSNAFPLDKPLIQGRTYEAVPF